jgi:phage terminase large subunit-like protein
MVESLRTATANRENSLEMILSTAGHDRTTIYYEELLYARKVRDGLISDPAHLPMIWEADEAADWTDPEVWKTACPNLGVTVTLKYLQKLCDEAKRNPRKENTFRRLYLNQFTSQETRWISMREVDDCWGSPGDLDPTQPSWGGLDMSAVEDLTAFVRVQRKAGGGFCCLGHYWTPHARLEAMRGQSLPVDQWIRDGWLTPIPGAVIDDAFIQRRVIADHKRGNLKDVGFDPAHARQIRIELESKGVTMVEVRQGAFTLGEPARVLEKAIKSGTLDHSGDPVLAWCLENVEVKTDDNGNIRPVKPSHGSQKKIDAVSALLNAIQRMIAAPAPKVLTADMINL